jgi:hypothetical protein
MPKWHLRKGAFWVRAMGALLWASALWWANAQTPRYTPQQLLDEVQYRAFRFFWEQADPNTGLVSDRAHNRAPETRTLASISATGYALASLPIAVERKWITRKQAAQRAHLTLQFILEKMPNIHGWYYHFVDKRTGERVWSSEVSTIDTALLVIGALTCGQYFAGTNIQRLANTLYNRLDWTWIRTNGGTRPDKQTLSMGWRPERGFITSEWNMYSEATLLYLLGLGADKNPLPRTCWESWTRKFFTYQGWQTLEGGPLFIHQMTPIYYHLRHRRDRLGFDYWVSSTNAMHIHRKFCQTKAKERKTYRANIWGLNASDGPKGYMAYGVPEPEDGTVSPTGVLAAILFTPEEAIAAGFTMYVQYGNKIWGKYGFSNAFNVDADWYGPDVIGIDLGMAMLAIENYRTGLIWRLIESHPSTWRAYKAAGLRKTQEACPRALYKQVERADIFESFTGVMLPFSLLLPSSQKTTNGGRASWRAKISQEEKGAPPPYGPYFEKSLCLHGTLRLPSTASLVPSSAYFG